MSEEAGEGQAEARTVPYDRFRTVVAAKNEASAQIESLQAQIQQLSEKAATVDTLAAQLETVRTEAAQMQAAHAEDTALMSAGLLDSSARVVARALHGALGDGAPPLADWLAGMREAPDKMPPALAAYLQPPAPPSAAQPRANPRAGVDPTAQHAAGDPITAESIRAVRERCMSDAAAGKPDAWKPWQELRAKM